MSEEISTATSPRRKVPMSLEGPLSQIRMFKMSVPGVTELHDSTSVYFELVVVSDSRG